MAKLWTANKTWASDSPNANTEYLVGVANGGCNYQSIPQGGTKRILVSNGANGNVAYGNRSVPLPEGYGNVPLPNLSSIPDCYVPNNKLADTHLYFPRDTVTLNMTANRFQFFRPTVSNSADWYFWFNFGTGGESDAQTLLAWIKQVKYFEKWFRGNNEVIVYNYKIEILDSTKWYLGNSNRRVQIDSQYVEMTQINSFNGKGDENPTCMLVPFK